VAPASVYNMARDTADSTWRRVQLWREILGAAPPKLALVPNLPEDPPHYCSDRGRLRAPLPTRQCPTTDAGGRVLPVTL
jgi:hypothetical protein